MEITVGSWNILNAFGDERAAEAFEVIKAINADVLYLCEMTLTETADSPAFRQIASRMSELGYVSSVTSDYTPKIDERNAQTMGMWVRAVASDVRRDAYSKRYGLSARVPAMDLTVTAMHADDRYPTERVAEGAAIIDT